MFQIGWVWVRFEGFFLDSRHILLSYCFRNIQIQIAGVTMVIGKSFHFTLGRKISLLRNVESTRHNYRSELILTLSVFSLPVGVNIIFDLLIPGLTLIGLIWGVTYSCNHVPIIMCWAFLSSSIVEIIRKHFKFLVLSATRLWLLRHS